MSELRFFEHADRLRWVDQLYLRSSTLTRFTWEEHSGVPVLRWVQCFIGMATEEPQHFMSLLPREA